MQGINDKINNMHMGKLIHMLSHEMKRNHPKRHRRRIPDPQINGHGICAIDGEERISDKRK